MTTVSDNPVLSSIDHGVALESPDITVYFAKNGERFDFVISEGDWSAYARAQAMAALESYAAIADLRVSITDDPEGASFRLTKTETEYGSLGFMNPPDPAYGDTQGIAWFNSLPYWGDAESGLLDEGSYMYTIFLHEFGHGLGLAHPFEAGGGSTVMPMIGDGMGLDQGIYTVMTYNDGWPEAPEGLPASRAWGWNLGPSAIDIAVLQAKYGANPETGSGATTYVLPDENAPGTGYLAIWDVGGRDTLRYSGAADAVIDLRAATLLAEEGGGGWVSHVAGIHGGFTIANGVVIERAIGGGGDDLLTGNAADNLLKGRGGADRISGDSGDDHLLGGAGGDRLAGGLGADRLEGGNGNDRLLGGKGQDVLTGGHGRDVLTGGGGADTFVIAPGDGRARITDFSEGDLLDLTAFDFAEFAAIEAGLSLVDNGLLLDLDSALVRLIGIDSLSADLVAL
ncbi:M10 family metallopeptidase C-terminal domain-containing protein [Pseudodonghicola flavimaris]|uniref:M10 family metallopeptidase C-terminal domain-containing protein n=1 Tax=Pseudodonghicola flavimaris TaxID=3050036 RepID=A0ABT7F6J9_9RHOB|nr:M10 family metallopeptidase C-terminal domain-containing protein [Pseudodonghicola flavimaris]MDK3020135.1 M10 family metallopeptidase C-terminal domain-containing protein [Pseudodonghicola flavimaris]